MSKNSDTAISIGLRKAHIVANISIDNCKECVQLELMNNVCICTNEDPRIDNCNLLKNIQHI